MKLSRHFLPTVFALVASVSLSACGTSRYMGIALTPGAADPSLQQLAQRARAGDKHAQLALGIYYEEGNGVAQDVKRAQNLYRLAATSSGGKTFVYVPASRKGGKGAVMPMNMGSRVEGLAEAAKRLTSIAEYNYKKKFETGYTDITGARCDTFWPKTLAQWQRSHHFIVEGKLWYRFIDPARILNKRRLNGSLFQRENDHYEVKLNVARYIKWPERFPKLNELLIKGHVTDSRWTNDEDGTNGGCITWSPRGEKNNASAILVLGYSSRSQSGGGFEIISVLHSE